MAATTDAGRSWGKAGEPYFRPLLALQLRSSLTILREEDFRRFHSTKYASEYQHVASYVSAAFILPAETISTHVIQGTLDIGRQGHTYPESHVVFHDKRK